MSDPTTNQERDENGKWLPGVAPNPEGKGGFQERPEDRSDGRWSKENSFSYWYNFFKHLTVAELKEWLADNPDDKRSVAADLAYRRVFNSQKDLKEFQEVADRSEGKARQSVDVTTAGEKINIAMVKFLDADDTDRNTDTK